jgi:hypothetical protein
VSSFSFISQGDAIASLSLKPTGISGMSEVHIKLYGVAFPFLDIAFEYKTYESEYWKTDAVLISGDGLDKDGNILKGLECSTFGKDHIVYWSHKSNGLADGQECLIRARILPSTSVFLSSEFGTWEERISNHHPECVVSKFVVNKDRDGNLICVSTSSIEIVDTSGLLVASIPTAGTPSFALQKTDGNYLILDSDNNQIIEIGSNYIDLVRTTDISAYVNGPLHMAYDDSIKNLLVSGGSIPKVYEFTYGEEDYGTLLWEHGDGTIGSGTAQLDSPYGVTYDEDRSIVYVADYGNDRIVKIDRRETSPQILSSIQIGDAQIPVNLPKFIQATGNESFLIVEGQGEQEYYSRDLETHPSLKRYNNNSPDKTGDKDDLPEYNNLLFSPLLNVIFRNAGWESSSSSSVSSSSINSSSSSSSSYSSLSSISSESSISSPSISSSSSLSSPSSFSSSSSIEQAKLYFSAIDFLGSPEWFEITNAGPYARDMTGWYVLSHEQPPPCPVATPSQKYRFPSGFILSGGASVRVYSGAGSSSAYNNPPTQLWWGIGNRWHDDGDIADLYNQNDIIIDTISFGNCV